MRDNREQQRSTFVNESFAHAENEVRQAILFGLNGVILWLRTAGSAETPRLSVVMR